MDDRLKYLTAFYKAYGIFGEAQTLDNQSKQEPGKGNGGAKSVKKPRRFTYQSGSTVLSGYTIQRGLGVGGFGEVYFAISDAGKEVALKRIQRNLDIEIRGVRQCLNLKHVNLISLWDIRQDAEGESWVVMEYVPGESLRDALERNPNGIPHDEGRDWFLGILNGVNYLHEHGIVHRDLKPGNVFYDQDENVVKLGDYGLSKFMPTSRRGGQTESVGTFHYMAPEIGKGNYGKEIDIYSLGIILCEILSGQVPFDGESGQEIIMKHLTDMPELGIVPDGFRQVIGKALSKDPANRFSSVQEMIDALNWTDTQQCAGYGVSSTEASGEPNLESVLIQDNGIQPANDRPIQVMELTGSAGSREPRLHEDDSLRTLEVNLLPETSVLQTEKHRDSITTVMASGDPEVSEPVLGTGAMLVKVVLIACLGLVVLFNAQWLIPASIVFGCVYMAYYTFWPNAMNRNNLADKLVASAMRPFSRKASFQLIERKVHEQRLLLTFTEKLTEVMGSLLMATLVICVTVVVSIGLSGFALDGSSATLSLFAWICLTSWLGSASSIGFAKIFEPTHANQSYRRFWMMASGLLVGAVSYGLYKYLLIDSVLFPGEMAALVNSPAFLKNQPDLTRFLLFFAGLFWVVRWWKLGDPMRVSQLKIVYLIPHAMLGVSLAFFTSFPLLCGLIISGTMSLTIQISSPWIRTSDRERVQAEIMQAPNT
ncbi:MAG: serine/threonine-protein kinase [Planctomycetota bacterium]|nr:serine/threonine-protein kinase [Planctomycetota bacterium]